MSKDRLDRAKDIRQGEELDINKLKTYLDDHGVNTKGLAIKQFPGGFSNLTYLVKTDEKEYVLRRPPFGANIKGGHDMSREFKVLSLLEPHYDKIPQPVLFCDDHEVMGADFYLMTRAHGVILRTKNALELKIPEDIMKKLSANAVDTFAHLHSLDIHETGLVQMGKLEGYTERQVAGWTRRWHKAKTEAIPKLEEMAVWLSQNMPKSYTPAFIHNDYKYDNMVLKADKLSEIEAILDWEMATIGDPLTDLGSTLAYWAEGKDPDLVKTFNPSYLPGNLTRQQFVDRYQEKTGREVNDLVFYYVY
ncbi:MAG: phosphotransferase family protein, partial [Bacteroidota bacterium]